MHVTLALKLIHGIFYHYLICAFRVTFRPSRNLTAGQRQQVCTLTANFWTVNFIHQSTLCFSGRFGCSPPDFRPGHLSNLNKIFVAYPHSHQGNCGSFPSSSPQNAQFVFLPLHNSISALRTFEISLNKDTPHTSAHYLVSFRTFFGDNWVIYNQLH